MRLVDAIIAAALEPDGFFHVRGGYCEEPIFSTACSRPASWWHHNKRLCTEHKTEHVRRERARNEG